MCRRYSHAADVCKRICLQDKFADTICLRETDCWIADKICFWESQFALSAKNMLISWIADRTSFHTCLRIIFLQRQICWIADIICLQQRTDLLNCWHNLLRDDRFAELLTNFADIMNFLLEFATNEYPCRLGWSNNITKILALRQSEHGWRGLVSESNLTASLPVLRDFYRDPQYFEGLIQ